MLRQCRASQVKQQWHSCAAARVVCATGQCCIRPRRMHSGPRTNLNHEMSSTKSNPSQSSFPLFLTGTVCRYFWGSPLDPVPISCDTHPVITCTASPHGHAVPRTKLWPERHPATAHPLNPGHRWGTTFPATKDGESYHRVGTWPKLMRQPHASLCVRRPHKTTPMWTDTLHTHL